MYSWDRAKARGVLFGLFLGFYASAAVAFGKPVPDQPFPLFDNDPPSQPAENADAKTPFYPQNLWLLQSGGLYRLDVDGERALERRPAKNADALALQPSNGTVWFADNQGIDSVTLDGEPLLDAPIPLPGGEKVTGLAVDDANGLLWAVTDSGLHQLSVTGRYLDFISLSKISSAPVWMRNRGDVWVLANGQVQRFNINGELLGVVAIPGMDKARVLAATQAGRGAWLAGKDRVAGSRSDGTLAAGPWKHGLKHVEFVSGDGEGGVWLAGNKNIVHLDAAGRITVRFRTRKGAAIRALAADRRDGSAWFASSHSVHKLSLRQTARSSRPSISRNAAAPSWRVHCTSTTLCPKSGSTNHDRKPTPTTTRRRSMPRTRITVRALSSIPSVSR